MVSNGLPFWSPQFNAWTASEHLYYGVSDAYTNTTTDVTIMLSVRWLTVIPQLCNIILFAILKRCIFAQWTIYNICICRVLLIRGTFNTEIRDYGSIVHQYLYGHICVIIYGKRTRFGGVFR